MPTQAEIEYKKVMGKDYTPFPNRVSENVNSTATKDSIEKVKDAKSTIRWDSPIPQTERMLVSRPRSISSDPNKYITSNGGDRGTRAYIKLLTQNQAGVDSRLVDSDSTYARDTASLTSDGPYGGYADFLLTGISCNLEEKIQVTQVFGDAEVIYYFGRRPMIFNFSGLLVDSVDNNWFVHWLNLYNGVMRGSQLAKNYELLKIVLPNMTLVGTINNFSWQQESANDVSIPFSFQFLAKRIDPVAADLPNGAFNPKGISSLKFSKDALPSLSISQIEEIKRRSSTVEKAIQDPNTTSADLARITAASSASAVPTLGSNGVATFSTKSDLGIVDTDKFKEWSSTFSGVRTQLFSPTFGVLSSLTKLVKVATGNVSGVVGVFSGGVNGVLRDINHIAYGATNLVNMVNTTIKDAAAKVAGIRTNYRNTLAKLKKTKGVITNSPSTTHNSLHSLVSSGRVKGGSLFLSGSVGHPSSGPLLFRIAKARAISGVSLPLSGGKRMSIMLALSSGTPRTRERGPTL